MAETLAGYAPSIITVVLLLMCSGFFSGSEAAIFALSTAERADIRNSGRVWHSLAWRAMRRPDQTLLTILLVNLLVNIWMYAELAGLGIQLAGDGYRTAGWVVTAAAPFVVILFAEILPKVLAWTFRRYLSVLASIVLLGLWYVLRPLLWVLNTFFVTPASRLIIGHAAASATQDDVTQVTGEELTELLRLTAQEGGLGRHQHQLLQEVLELRHLRVRDAMVPRVDMVAIDAEASLDQLQALIRHHRVSRVPVYRGDVDNIAGYVTARRALSVSAGTIADMLQPVRFVPETQCLDVLLTSFASHSDDFALVVDEHGGLVGLITRHDVAEQIVGPIVESSDDRDEPLVVELEDGCYSLDGDVPVRDWIELLGQPVSNPLIVTVGGLVMSQLGRLPRVGDRVRFGRAEFRVTAMQHRRINRLYMRLVGADSTDAGPTDEKGGAS